MKKLASTLPNMILSLGIITILSGLLLGWMFTVTEKPIEESARKMQADALAEVLPEYDNDPEQMMSEVTVDGQKYAVYPAEMNGRLTGAAVKGSSMDGFAGEIVVICGFDIEGSIINYRVLKQAETPGLGEKMEVWFRDPTAARSVIGKSPAMQNFTPSKDGGDIDGITAATISSRAFLSIIRGAYSAYQQYMSARGERVEEAPEHHTGASVRNE